MSSIWMLTVALLASTGGVFATMGLATQENSFIATGAGLLLMSMIGSFIGLLGALVTICSRSRTS